MSEESVIAKFVGTKEGFILSPPKGQNGIERAIVRAVQEWILYYDRDKHEVNWIPKDQFEKCK